MQTPLRQPRSDFPVTAFTLTELLVVIAVLALLATTQLPALTRAKAPVKFTQCQNNLRQIGQATLIYKDENNDCFPYGNRCLGPGNYIGSVVDPNAWPRQLLRYLGGYQTNIQPPFYACPSETDIATNWVFQVYYQVNRTLVPDTDSVSQPLRGAQVRSAARYWMFMDKSAAAYCNIKPGGLALALMIWNVPPGSPAYRRHGGGVNAVAADGHAEWLRTPPYQPGRPAPANFLELGDCASGQNPGSTWKDPSPPGNDNGYRVKLYTRYYALSGF